MQRPSQPWTIRFFRGLRQLRRRREVEWLAFYLGAAWIIYESVGLTVDTFGLPTLVVRVTAIVLALGATLSVPLAHWYALTARELDRAGGVQPDDVPGVPDVLEGALAKGYRRVRGRTALFAGAGSTLLFSGFFFVLWSAWAAGHERIAPDPRVSVVVFPFRASGPDAASYGEGIADLLTVALDGTQGVRVADPASIWSELRPERAEPALAPEPDEAVRLSQRAGARRFVTGAIVAAGTSLDVSARVHDAASGATLAALQASGDADSLTAIIDRLTIDLVADLWEREQLPTVPEIERYATSNAEALKAYLEAKSLSRRGLFQPAEEAIERAVTLDSTFALAHLEHFHIRSWLLYLNVEPYIGLTQIVERAMRYRERLTPRNRLRVEASRALDDTDGARAAFLLERIIGIDSLDVDALHSLAFTYLRDGWQIGKSTDAIMAAYDRVVAADPLSVAARLNRAGLALSTGDSALARQLYESVAASDSSPLVLGSLGAYQALKADSSATDSILRVLAQQPVPVVATAARALRQLRPELAERLAIELMNDSLPAFHQRVGSGMRTQLWLAAGRLAAVDSLVRAGALDPIRQAVNRFFVSARIAGVGLEEATVRSVSELASFAPAESLTAYLNSRPAVWATAWSVAAYQASLGDTAEARLWQAALAELPAGSTWWDWRGSLTADIEARLAVRRGDLELAESQAQQAYDLWPIHSNYAGEAEPEVAIRFHLAQILLARGATERAAWLYRSFTPPHTWIGFYTARASFEIAQIEEERGNLAEARRHYLIAARLWEQGEPNVVGDWLARTREGLRRLAGESA